MSAPSFSVVVALSFAWQRTWSNFRRLLLVAMVGLAIYLLVILISGALELLLVGTGAPSSAIDPTELLDDPTLLLLDPTVYQTNPITYLTPRNGVNLVVTVVQVLVTLYLFLGVTRIAIAVTAGTRVTVSQLFAPRGFGRYVAGTVIHTILLLLGVGVPVGIGVAVSALTNQAPWTTIGTIVGGIVAIVVTLGFIFFGYVILDQNSQVLSGIRQSHEMVRPHVLRLLVLYVLVGIIMAFLFTVAWLLGTRTDMIGFLIAFPFAVALLIGLFGFSTGFVYRQLSDHLPQQFGEGRGRMQVTPGRTHR